MVGGLGNDVALEDNGSRVPTCNRRSEGMIACSWDRVERRGEDRTAFLDHERWIEYILR